MAGIYETRSLIKTTQPLLYLSYPVYYFSHSRPLPDFFQQTYSRPLVNILICIHPSSSLANLGHCIAWLVFTLPSLSVLLDSNLNQRHNYHPSQQPNPHHAILTARHAGSSIDIPPINASHSSDNRKLQSSPYQYAPPPTHLHHYPANPLTPPQPAQQTQH